MERKPQRGGASPDRDGIRVVRDDQRRLRGSVLLIVVVSTVLAAILVLRRASSTAPTTAPEGRERIAGVTGLARVPARADGPVGVARAAAERPEDIGPPAGQRATVGRRPKPHVARISPEREPPGDTGEERHVEVSARNYITALRESGETAGLAAFPPPGTRPPRPGVIVPSDYQLPEGFARHYQTTDDGRQLAPILVVAPGYEIVDDAGEPIALTDDRIVPPEYAPPDLPVQMLEVPAEQDSGDDAR